MQNYISVIFLNLSDFEDNWISPECRTLPRVCGGRMRRGRRVGCSGIWELYFNGSECLDVHESFILFLGIRRNKFPRIWMLICSRI